VQAFAQQNVGAKWALDANASWSPEVALALLPVLASYAPRPYMLEQPYGLDFVPRQDRRADAAWKAVVDAYGARGLYVYADESMATAEDVALFGAGHAHGVNVKLEKAGGLRGALRALVLAQQMGLRTWIGIMVSSALGTAQAAQLVYVAGEGDLDGGLLVFPDRFDGGFEWGTQGEVLLSKDVGFGVREVVPLNGHGHGASGEERVEADHVVAAKVV
jgi:L-alanine-DL-glutamate epimerase-like enolase superfamily enzyme